MLFNKRKLKSFGFASNLCAQLKEISNHTSLFDPPDEFENEKKKLTNENKSQAKRTTSLKRPRDNDDDDDDEEVKHVEEKKPKKNNVESSAKKLIVKKSSDQKVDRFKEEEESELPFGASNEQQKGSDSIKYDSIPAMGRKFDSILFFFYKIQIQHINHKK